MNSTAELFSEDLRSFINDEQWRFANRMPDWPHEYLVENASIENSSSARSSTSDPTGTKASSFTRRDPDYEEGDLVHRTIGAPVEETVIINRCRKGESFESSIKAVRREINEVRPQPQRF